MQPPSALPPARQSRRKERTRMALIGAAQRLIAEGQDAHASIQVITELADVGFGSFYNYFSSKEDLFEAAASAAVDDYLRWLDERLSDGGDPVARLVESVRLTGRLALEHPGTAAILTRRLMLLENVDDPRGLRIRADVLAALSASGAASHSLEFDILATATLGAITAVLQRIISLSPTEIVEAADTLAPAIVRLVSRPSAEPAR